MMLVYTSITKSYLPKARVLASSVKRFHPDWKFVLLFSDDLPDGFDLKSEPFDEILTMDQLELPNWKAWCFGHALVELCTAVKGPAAEVMAKRPGVDKIMYLDPDIKVYSSLTALEGMLDTHDVLLTPHLLDAETQVEAIRDNEISALKHGIYNLGFFAAKTRDQGLDFIRWWASRLKLFCRDDIPSGLFTDQRWCDLAPAFFSKLLIIRDRGYNVATWNIAHRSLSKDASGQFQVAGVPLRFYHFTSYDSGAGMGMLKKYASNLDVAHDLWDDYGKDLQVHGQNTNLNKKWFFNNYENGEVISLKARRVYQLRGDLQNAFPNPYSMVEPSFYSWWKANEHLAPADTQARSLTNVVRRSLTSPGEGVRLLKVGVNVIKEKGIAGFIKKLREYTL